MSLDSKIRYARKPITSSCLLVMKGESIVMEVINISNKFKLFSEHWTPKKIGELNGQQVLLAKLKGEFIWHKHENEDELFMLTKGCLKIEFVLL